MPGPLLTSKEINAGAVTTPKRDFDTRMGKQRECFVFFSFSTAETDFSMPHALGRTPIYFTVVQSGGPNTAGTPEVPRVYSKDPSFWATKNVVMLRSDTANTWAIVSLR